MSLYYICSHCNSTHTTLKGKSKTGSPIYLCNDCKRKSSLYKVTKEFDLKKMLPIHIKLESQLSNRELYALGVVLARAVLLPNGHIYIDIPNYKSPLLELVCSILTIPKQPFPIRSNLVRLSYYNQYSVMFWFNLGLALRKKDYAWLSYMNNPHFIRGMYEASVNNSMRLIISSPLILNKMEMYIKQVTGDSCVTPYNIKQWYSFIYSKCGDMKLDWAYDLIYKAHPNSINTK